MKLCETRLKNKSGLNMKLCESGLKSKSEIKSESGVKVHMVLKPMVVSCPWYIEK